MDKIKKSTNKRRKLFFSLLFILLFIFFGFLALLVNIENSKATSQSDTTGSCTTSYSEWSTCSSSGFQERIKTTACPGAVPYTSTERQTCTYKPNYFPCTDYTYSAWSTTCLNGYYTRSVISGLPTGCLTTLSGSATPITKKACALTSSTSTECTSFTYSAWGVCTTTGIQTRDVIASYPSGCSGGNPEIKRSCTYTNTTQTSEGTAYSTQDSTTYNSISGQNTDTTPELTFLEISDGTFLSGRFLIKGRVDSAKGVEFYLIPLNSNTPKYIGSALNPTNNYWELSFDTASFPNGSFYLVAKIKNDYGIYDSSKKIRVNINNEIFSDLSMENKETGTTDSLRETAEITVPVETDSDKDGLSDNDEIRYKTNPKNPDSDGDGFLDGDEIKNGFNPLQFSPGDRSDKIVFESPKEIGEVKKEAYQIHNVEMVASPEGKKELRLSGKGLPNSFVTIYVYSDLPIILTVKTDSSGNWSYVLDKQIEDGEHQVYVAVTDNTGKITAKSEPLFFVKTAEAATIIPAVEAGALAARVAPTEKRRTKDFMVIAAIIILAFVTALTAIGFYIIHAHKKSERII